MMRKVGSRHSDMAHVYNKVRLVNATGKERRMAKQMSDGEIVAGATERGATGRIVVALDASPNSVAALRAAVELASWLGLELEGVFVEDINLTRLGELPNQYEVGSYTGTVRRLDNLALQRQLRALAASMRQAMAREAGRRPIRWDFSVRRGPVVTELLAASQSASVVSVGRTGRGRRSSLGSTAQSIVRECSRPVLVSGQGVELRLPLTVVFTGTEASERAMQFVLNLRHQRIRNGIRILVWGGDNSQRLEDLRRRAASLVQQAGADALIISAVAGSLSAIVGQEPGTLVLARENADLLSQHRGPTILVP